MSRSRAKSSAFLLEFVIILLVFSLASAVCVRLFVTARSLASDSERLDCAVAAATTASETLKASDGSDEAVEALFGAERALYFSDDWRVCDAADAAYVITADLSASDSAAGRLLSGSFSVKPFSRQGLLAGSLTDESLYTLKFARFYPARGEAAQ